MAKQKELDNSPPYTGFGGLNNFRKNPLSVETTVRRYDNTLHCFLTMFQKQQNESRESCKIFYEKVIY